MRSISHREMRNNSADVLRAVEAGESVIVTNRGKSVAKIIPFAGEETPLEELRSLGQTRPPQRPVSALKELVPVEIDVSTAQLIRESRRDW